MDVIKADDGQNEDFVDDSGVIISTLLHAASFVRSKFGEFLQHYEMTEGRFAVLATLHSAGLQGLSQSEVADQLHQSESNISSLIERLHRDRLVDRRWSDTDRRKRVLLLTAEGTRRFLLVETGRRRWARSLLANIDRQGRKALTDGLSELDSHLNKPASDTVSIKIPVHPTPPAMVWSGRNAFAEPAPASPQFALEQMLSTLGLANRFSEGQ